VVAVQGIIIPKLRKRLLVLGRERQLTARALAGRIAECVEGAAEIHAHDTSNYERAEISARLGRIFRIRFELYQRKFMVKFLNNFLSQVTPFLCTLGAALPDVVVQDERTHGADGNVDLRTVRRFGEPLLKRHVRFGWFVNRLLRPPG